MNTKAGVIPNLPIKRFTFGLQMMSLAPPNNHWTYFCNPNSFDTFDEARAYMDANRGSWNEDGHPHSGILELTGTELEHYNDFWAVCHICGSRPYQPTDRKSVCSRCGCDE